MPDPLARFRRWFEAARRSGAPLHEAGALATADRRGRPSVRFVLLKGADARGFLFFTNTISRKGRDLSANPHAALAFYWDTVGRQVNIRGPVRRITPAEADVYWDSRPRGSNLAALASRQSAPLKSRAELVAEVRRLSRLYRGKAIPRPPGWTGWRILPGEIEFWTRGADRLHHRELFVHTPRGWSRRLLYP